jgi:SAM-dependent methyltransferase
MRPGYPAKAVDYLVERLDLRPGRTVLDLAAGTGKLTRLLTPSGARIVAVEPLDGMRAELERAVPGVQALAGSAEAIPLDDASVDAVTVAQAFHWFRFAEAIPELRRVLRPGGALALLWNEWDSEDPRYAAVEQVIESLRAATPYPVEGWRDALIASSAFGPLEECRFPYEEELELEHAVQREATTSVVSALPAAEREEFLGRIREALRGFGEPVRFRGWTEVFVSEAV